MAIVLPGHGVYEGEHYCSQLKSYFKKPCDTNDEPRDYAFLYEEFGMYPNVITNGALPAFLQKRMERSFFAHLMKQEKEGY